MQKLIVHTKKSLSVYSVLVGAKVEVAAAIAVQAKASKAAVVCSKNTRVFAERIADALNAANLANCLIEIQDDEENKRLSTLNQLIEKMREEKLDRDSIVIAVGGGVIGDVAGFAAAVFNRGVSLIQVPTTLLAMADSSIGGKVGVNFHEKNFIGAFHQPKAVVIDFSTLKTLSKEELRQGFAEIIKAACIRSPQLFEFLEKNSDKALALDEEALKQILQEAIRIKVDVVSTDERESRMNFTPSSRMVLNFGHSIGHAVEKSSNSKIRHGGAVSIGMVGECNVSRKLGMLSEVECKRIESLLEKFGLPLSAKGLDAEKTLDALRRDKKNRSGELVMVLLQSIGSPVIVQGVPEDVVNETLRMLVE